MGQDLFNRKQINHCQFDLWCIDRFILRCISNKNTLLQKCFKKSRTTRYKMLWKCLKLLWADRRDDIVIDFTRSKLQNWISHQILEFFLKTDVKNLLENLLRNWCEHAFQGCNLMQPSEKWILLQLAPTQIDPENRVSTQKNDMPSKSF